MPLTRPLRRSMTSTSLSPELTAYSVPPSADRASPSGLDPTGAPGYGARLMVRLGWPAPAGITLTESLSLLATYSAPVRGSTAIRFGCVPTVMVVTARGTAPEMSSTVTVSDPWSLTYAVRPSGEIATPYGLCPTPTVLIWPEARSITDAASAIWSATTSRLPSGVTASPAGYMLTGRPAGFVSGSWRGGSSVRAPPLTEYTWIFSLPPPLAYARVPSGPNATPAYTPSGDLYLIVCDTWLVEASTAWTDSFVPSPASSTSSRLPSGLNADAVGRVPPSVVWDPAGVTRQPTGVMLVPSPCGPACRAVTATAAVVPVTSTAAVAALTKTSLLMIHSFV